MELASVATANRSDQLSPFGVLLGQTPFTTKETARSQADRVDPGPDCDDATEERATSLPLAGSEKGKRLEPTISSSSISRTSVSSFFRTSKAPGIDKWNNKGSEVSDIIYARHGYERLQDLCSDQIKYICPDQLKHLKTLGVGTFAEVSIAEYCDPDQMASPQCRPCHTVAVKALKAQMAQNEHNVVDFIEEVRVISRINHRGIVKIFGVGSFDTSTRESEWRTIFLVQEYMNSGSLKSLILRSMVRPNEVQYSYSDALRWSISAAEAISFLHAHKPMIIHRDLKADNILLTKVHVDDKKDEGTSMKRSVRLEAKVSDLGLHALVKDCAHNFDSLGSFGAAIIEADPMTPMQPVKNYDTAEKSSVGKPLSNSAFDLSTSYRMTGRTGAFCYMAPEVFMNLPYNEKVDVFAFGIVLYEVFARRLLAADYLNAVELDEGHRHASQVAAGYRPPFPSKMPLEIVELVEMCWAGPPELRPRMKILARKLKEIQASSVMEALDAPQKFLSAGCCAVM